MAVGTRNKLQFSIFGIKMRSVRAPFLPSHQYFDCLRVLDIIVLLAYGGASTTIQDVVQIDL